jgi:hypothetical protein
VLQRWPRGPIKSHVIIVVPARHVLEESNAAMATESAQHLVASVSAKVDHVSILTLRHVGITRMARARRLPTTRQTIPHKSTNLFILRSREHLLLKTCP